MTASPAGQTAHNPAIDVAKGVGIVLVVIGHTWRGLETSGLIGNATLYRVIDTLIYNFHMPLFFVLSGMTFEKWALRRDWGVGLGSRVARLLWPLVAWTYIFAAVRSAIGQTADPQAGMLADLAFWPLPPQDHFWFLWALFLQHILVFALIRAVGRPIDHRIWLTLAAAAVVISSTGLTPLNAYTYGATVYLAAFLTGLWLAARGLPHVGMAGFAVAAALFAGLEAASFVLPPSLAGFAILGITIALCALAMIAALCRGAPAAPLRMLGLLGKASMGIFLTHTMFSFATRAALAQITDATVPHLLAGTMAGILGPLVIYQIIHRVGRPAWIGF